MCSSLYVSLYSPLYVVVVCVKFLLTTAVNGRMLDICVHIYYSFVLLFIAACVNEHVLRNKMVDTDN